MRFMYLVYNIKWRTLSLFQNRTFNNSLFTKREEKIWDCRKLQNEEPYDLYSSSNIVRAVKLTKIKRVVHVVKENANTALAGILNLRDHLDDTDFVWRITLKLILKY
jgi:hypothetical protein